jgi:YidC/Oxa1 family membrane protein insertase
LQGFGFFELFSAALAAFYAVVPSYGLAIILLTILTRLLLLPLSIKQTKSMREMQVIQPEIKKIQQKNKGDRQKMNEEMMALYKEHGVNPFGGCLPLLMQFPVFIGLYRVVLDPLAYLAPPLLAGSALAAALSTDPRAVNSFLGVMQLDCTLTGTWSGDPAHCGSGLIAALPYIILVGLMGATTYFQTKQMQAGRGSDQAQQMQMVGRIMPILLVVFGLNFPSGVVLYWFTTNLWTIGQQRLILGRFGPPPEVGGTKSGGGKKETKKDPKKDAKSAKMDASGNSKAKGKGSQRTEKTGQSGNQPNNGERTRAGTSRASKKRRRR